MAILLHQVSGKPNKHGFLNEISLNVSLFEKTNSFSLVVLSSKF